MSKIIHKRLIKWPTPSEKSLMETMVVAFFILGSSLFVLIEYNFRDPLLSLRKN